MVFNLPGNGYAIRNKTVLESLVGRTVMCKQEIGKVGKLGSSGCTCDGEPEALASGLPGD
jgi:hypothetical protein